MGVVEAGVAEAWLVFILNDLALASSVSLPSWWSC